MKFSFKSLFVLLCAVVLTGCDVKDDFMDRCYQPYMLRVLMDPDADDSFDLSPFAANDVSQMIEPTQALIYVFSEQGILLGTHQAPVGAVIPLPYKDYPKIRVVAVGTDNSVTDLPATFSQLVVGQAYAQTDLLFALTPLAHQVGFAQSPIDFMYDANTFDINPNNDKNIVYYLHLKPRTGAVKIKTKNLAAWADSKFGPSGLAQDQFTFTVGVTSSRYNIGGSLYGDKMSYQPATVIEDSNPCTPMFNLLPTQGSERLTIKIYRNQTEVLSYDSPYRVPPRTPYIIFLDFGSSGDPGFQIIPAEFEQIIVSITF